MGHMQWNNVGPKWSGNPLNCVLCYTRVESTHYRIVYVPTHHVRCVIEWKMDRISVSSACCGCVLHEDVPGNVNGGIKLVPSSLEVIVLSSNRIFMRDTQRELIIIIWVALLPLTSYTFRNGNEMESIRSDGISFQIFGCGDVLHRRYEDRLLILPPSIIHAHSSIHKEI